MRNGSTRFEFTLSAATSILMHRHNIEGLDGLREYINAPENRDKCKPGDDRTPPWTWMISLYHDGEHLAIPSEVVMACLRNAGKKMTMKGRQTYKSATQSAIRPEGEYFEFLNNGKKISLAAIEELRNLPFSGQCAGAKALGFSLYVKPVSINSAKHIRVRARFDNWSVRGCICVDTDVVNKETLDTLFDVAGVDIGLLDNRPSSPRNPGPFGQFGYTLRQAKSAHTKVAA